MSSMGAALIESSPSARALFNGSQKNSESAVKGSFPTTQKRTTPKSNVRTSAAAGEASRSHTGGSVLGVRLSNGVPFAGCGERLGAIEPEAAHPFTDARARCLTRAQRRR